MRDMTFPSTARDAPRAPYLAITLICVACALGGCSKFDVLNATVPVWGYARNSNIAYGPLARQKLDVYRPKEPAPARRDGERVGARVVVFFCGGDWQEGEKENYRFVGQALASRGFIAVLPNYRLYPETTFPGLCRGWGHGGAVGP